MENSSFDKKLSFIVPSYNSERYLAHCLDSILRSKLDSDDFEIIVWDDGSNDNSVLIANQYVERNPQIKVYHEKNRGVSYARNMALHKAIGRYVWFVDADDIVESENVGRLLDIIEKDDLDFLVFNFNYEEPNGTRFLGQSVSSSKIATGLELYYANPISLVVWRIIYRRSFLIDNSISFPLDYQTSEDFYFNYKAWFWGEKVKSVPIVGYNYVQNQYSLIHSTPWKIIVDNITQIKKIITDFKSVFPRKYLETIIYDRLRNSLTRLRFVSEKDIDLALYEQIVKDSLVNYCPMYSIKGLFIGLMKYTPLVVIRSISIIRKLKK